MTDLSDLRMQIDEVDKALLALIAKRLSIVEKVGEVKKAQGLPIYVPEREALMLEARKAEAAKIGVNPAVIESILRRLMQESYEHENDTGFYCVNPRLKDIVIIGGKGQLGALFARLFRLSGYQVKILEKNDWAQSADILKSASLVLVAVPISLTEQVIAKLSALPKDCILADLTSIKAKPLEAMLKVHSGPVVGFHPMFAPANNIAKQMIIYCDGRKRESYQWLLEQFKIWGSNLKQIDAKEHDKFMQLVQALRHFTTFTYGLHLTKENPDIEKLMALSSPIYRLELLMVGRLFAQNAELYSDIIMSSTDNIKMIKSFALSLNNAIALLEKNDKAEFIREFELVRQWFGDYAASFLTESQQLLHQAKK